MRAVIYCVRDGKSGPLGIDFETAIFDREIDSDIKKCNQLREAHGEKADASWDDYLPVAAVEVGGAGIVEGKLCVGGTGYTAYEVLIGKADHIPDVRTVRLDGGPRGSLGIV